MSVAHITTTELGGILVWGSCLGHVDVQVLYIISPTLTGCCSLES